MYYVKGNGIWNDWSSRKNQECDVTLSLQKNPAMFRNCANIEASGENAPPLLNNSLTRNGCLRKADAYLIKGSIGG